MHGVVAFPSCCRIFFEIRACLTAVSPFPPTAGFSRCPDHESPSLAHDIKIAIHRVVLLARIRHWPCGHSCHDGFKCFCQRSDIMRRSGVNGIFHCRNLCSWAAAIACPTTNCSTEPRKIASSVNRLNFMACIAFFSFCENLCNLRMKMNFASGPQI